MTTKATLSGKAGTLLHCTVCDAQFSATPNDYFWMPDDAPFMCECGEELSEVRKQTRFVGVTR